MKTIHQIQPDLLHMLEEYREWVFTPDVQKSLNARFTSGTDSRLRKLSTPEQMCSLEAIQAIDHQAHNGFPDFWYGIDLNYSTVKNESAQYESQFFSEVRKMNQNMDDRLQNALGARHCALKAFYPAQGYIPWHTNWNAPGYVILFTHSPTGNGYWRHMDPTGATSCVPRAESLQHIPDIPGWHCKIGYFGSKEETDKLTWHCAFTSEPRITLSYLIPERSIWQSMIEEISR